MERPATPERDERALPGIDSPFDAHASQGTSHRCIDDGNDGFGGCLTTRPDTRRERIDRRDRAVDVELDTITHRRAGDVAQRDVGVGDGRLRAPAMERDRTGPSPRAAWAHAERSSVIHPRQAAAASGDGFHEHACERDRYACHRAPSLEQRLAAEHQSHVGARSSDVDRQCPGDA